MSHLLLDKALQHRQVTETDPIYNLHHIILEVDSISTSMPM